MKIAKISDILVRILLFTLFLVFSFFGCQISDSGSSDSSETADESRNTKILGRLGSFYSTSLNNLTEGKLFSEDSTADGSTTVDQLTAFPISHPFVSSPLILADTVTADISSDGSFSISLDSSTDYIIALMNSTTEKKDRFVGYVALSDALDNMVLFPTSHITDDIDTGDLSADGNEAISENSLEDNVTNFDIDLAKLQEIARTDNLLKTVKNIYVNYNDQTDVYHSALFVFGWSMDSSKILNAFSLPDDLIYNGYQLSFGFDNQNELTFDQAVNKTITLEIVPPSEISIINSETHYDQQNPFIYDGEITIQERSDGSKHAQDANDMAIGLGANGSLQIGVFLPLSNLPEGWWTLKKDGIELTSYDFGIASPIGENNIPSVYIPSLNAIVDENDKIIQFEIKWYLYNFVNNQYDEITDLSTFKNIVEGVFSSWNDNATIPNEERADITDTTTTVIIPREPWYFFGSDNGTDHVLFALRFSYRIYGINFMVEIQPSM